MHSWGGGPRFLSLDQGSSCRRVRCYVTTGARVDGREGCDWEDVLVVEPKCNEPATFDKDLELG